MHSAAAAERFGRSRGGRCSKLHAYADGAIRILRLIVSPVNHADLRYATAFAAGIPACDVALDRGYVSAALVLHTATTKASGGDSDYTPQAIPPRRVSPWGHDRGCWLCQRFGDPGLRPGIGLANATGAGDQWDGRRAALLTASPGYSSPRPHNALGSSS